MPDLMLVELILCVIPVILAAFLLSDRPPTPPSNSMLQRKSKAKGSSTKVQGNLTQLGDEHDLDDDVIVLRTNSSGDHDNMEDQEQNWNLVFAKLRDESSTLFNNRNYIVLFIAFSIGVGFFNSLLTLLNQIVAPHGYSNDDAGTFGAVFIALGLVGAGIVGYLMKQTKAYRTIL
eukprot:gene36716-49496_t